MKVALVQPDMPRTAPFERIGSQVPLGLCYLAAVLENKGHEVKIFDSYLTQKNAEETAKSLLGFSPEIVGISCTSHVFPEARKIAKCLKEQMPNANVVFGGAHPSIFPQQVASLPYVDAVGIREGEITFLEYVNAIDKGNTVEKIEGLVFRKDKRLVVTPPRPFIKDLDLLPFPARHLVEMKRYPRRGDSILVHPVDTMNTSRGCPYNCLFCSTHELSQHIYRARSPSNIADEIEHLIYNWGSKGIYFREDNFTCSETRVRGLCKEIRKRKIDIEWECESRINVSENLLKNMKKAGCSAIWFGVESGSQKVLNYLRKGITISQIKKCVAFCKKVGIKVGASFMIGVPGETHEDVGLTFKLWKELDADFSWFSAYIAMPGSELYDIIKREGYYKDVWEDIFIVETPELSHEDILNYLKTISSAEAKRHRRKFFAEIISHPSITTIKYGFNVGVQHLKRRIGR